MLKVLPHWWCVRTPADTVSVCTTISWQGCMADFRERFFEKRKGLRSYSSEPDFLFTWVRWEKSVVVLWADSCDPHAYWSFASHLMSTEAKGNEPFCLWGEKTEYKSRYVWQIKWRKTCGFGSCEERRQEEGIDMQWQHNYIAWSLRDIVERTAALPTPMHHKMLLRQHLAFTLVPI